MGIEGLGTKSVVGAHLPVAQALVADLDHVGYQVNRENVLGVYQVLAYEALRLRQVMDEQGHKLEIEPCGGDPVSYDAERGFNAKLNRLRIQCNDYVDSLTNAAEQLRQAAQAYGYTEAQIDGSFRTASTGLGIGPLANPAPVVQRSVETSATPVLLKPALPDVGFGPK